MANHTNIGWTDATWNPVTGCSKVSSGCANCYAAAMAPRLARMGAKGYTELPWTAANAAANVQTHPEKLQIPLRTRSKKRFFVNSTSDVFHKQVPASFIARIFAVMLAAEQHTFQILTKRPERMAALLNDRNFSLRMLPIAYHELTGDCPDANGKQWPIPNLWLGVSVEDQQAADERIPYLLDTPAALRFLSCEPLLGPLDLRAVRCLEAAMTQPGVEFDPGQPMGTFDALRVPDGIDWVIAGGESGPDYREMDRQWAKDLRDDCHRTATAFFFKQTSSRRPEADIRLDSRVIRQFPDGPC